MTRSTLVSAALAASAAAASLCALTLHLNPEITLRAALPGLLLSLFLPWALVGAAGLGLLAFLATALRWWPRPFRPVVEGRPFLTALSFVGLAIVSAVYWHNLLAFRLALPVAGVRALAASAVVVTAATLVHLAIGIDVALFPRHARPFAGAAAILAMGAAVALPLALRVPARAAEAPPPVRLEPFRPARRVVVIGIDGLSPEAAGEPSGVPYLSRLALRGGAAPLATIRPAEGPPVWTTLMTGRLPRDHGIRSTSCYQLAGSSAEWALLPRAALVGVLERLGLASQRPVPSTWRRCRALWNVLDAFGASSGLVRVWGTHPPEPVPGFVLSPYFHLFATQRDGRAASTLHPRDLLREALALRVDPSQVDPGLLRELAEPRSSTAAPLDDVRLRRLAEEALAPDLTYQRVADLLRHAYDPSLLVISFHGYDNAGHRFYRYAHPGAFGNVDPDEARRYGRVLGGYAALLGAWVNGVEKQLQPGDLLVVVSGFGLAPTPLWQRLLGVLTGSETPTAGHRSAPPGLLLIVGEGVRPGARARSASVLDVAPTLLYLMGLPVARDMDGRVLTELVDPRYARDHALSFIRSYESLAVAPRAAPVAEDLPPLPDEEP